MVGTGEHGWLSGSPRWRSAKLLILRLTPRGLRLPRLVTARPSAISRRMLCSQDSRCSGGNGAGGRQAAPEDADGMDERQVLRCLGRGRGGLGHQTPHGGVGQQ